MNNYESWDFWVKIVFKQLFLKLFYLLLVFNLKVHKIEIFFGFDFEICIISLLVMWKY